MVGLHHKALQLTLTLTIQILADLVRAGPGGRLLVIGHRIPGGQAGAWY